MEYPVAYYTLIISHTFLTLFMSFGWISNNRTVLWILFMILVLGISLFIINNGCFITRLEYKLGGKGYTVIDPVLQKLGININRKSRTYFTILLFSLSLLITSYKLFLKDYDKDHK